jgi:hypothetical protein
MSQMIPHGAALKAEELKSDKLPAVVPIPPLTINPTEATCKDWRAARTELRFRESLSSRGELSSASIYQIVPLCFSSIYAIENRSWGRCMMMCRITAEAIPEVGHLGTNPSIFMIQCMARVSKPASLAVSLGPPGSPKDQALRDPSRWDHPDNDHRLSLHFHPLPQILSA